MLEVGAWVGMGDWGGYGGALIHLLYTGPLRMKSYPPPPGECRRAGRVTGVCTLRPKCSRAPLLGMAYGGSLSTPCTGVPGQ